MNKKLFTLTLLALAIEQGSIIAIDASGPAPVVETAPCCPQPLPACCPSPIIKRSCCPRPFFFKRRCGPVCAPRVRRIICAPCAPICRPKPICCPRIRCCRPKPVCCPQPLPACPPTPCVVPSGVVETPQPTCPTGNCPLAQPTEAQSAAVMPHFDRAPHFTRSPMRPDMPSQEMATAGSTAADVAFDDAAPVQEAQDY